LLNVKIHIYNANFYANDSNLHVINTLSDETLYYRSL